MRCIRNTEDFAYVMLGPPLGILVVLALACLVGDNIEKWLMGEGEPKTQVSEVE